MSYLPSSKARPEAPKQTSDRLREETFQRQPRLNDLNPYSLDADGWRQPPDNEVRDYDRKGPPVDDRASVQGNRSTRSTLAAHIAALEQQSNRPVAFEALWDRWSTHPRLESVRALFPVLTDEARRAALRAEVEDFPVRTTRGDTVALAKKMAASALPAERCDRVLSVLVELRHAWTSRSPDSVDSGYDDVNWRHACGEVAQVLEISRDAGLDPEATEDALLVSIFSDAAKLRGNFLTHHVDGAVAAMVLLPRAVDILGPRGRQRVAGICQAILEHQVGPPRFMASMVRLGIQGVLGKVGHPLDDVTIAILDGLQAKIADPMNPAHVERHAEGYGVLRMSREERALLKLIDLSDWYVPHPLTPWFPSSSAVIDADSLVNYVTPDGVGKIVAICGPGTPFADPTVFHSMFSCGASFVDAVSVMSDVAMASVQEGVQRTRTLIDKVREGVARELDRGVLTFAAEGFERILAEENVDVSQLKVRRRAGLVVVVLPSRQSIPYWNEPLDYQKVGPSFEVAKLLRRKMADLLRAV